MARPKVGHDYRLVIKNDLFELITMAKPALSITVLNLTKATSFVNAMKKATEKNLEKSMTKIAMFMEGEVKDSIAGKRSEIKRRDTSRYIRSVKGITPTKYSAQIYSNVEYGPYLEYGTSKMTAAHHFKNSLMRNTQKITDYIKKEL